MSRTMLESQRAQTAFNVAVNQYYRKQIGRSYRTLRRYSKYYYAHAKQNPQFPGLVVAVYASLGRADIALSCMLEAVGEGEANMPVRALLMAIELAIATGATDSARDLCAKWLCNVFALTGYAGSPEVVTGLALMLYQAYKRCGHDAEAMRLARDTETWVRKQCADASVRKQLEATIAIVFGGVVGSATSSDAGVTGDAREWAKQVLLRAMAASKGGNAQQMAATFPELPEMLAGEEARMEEHHSISGLGRRALGRMTTLPDEWMPSLHTRGGGRSSRGKTTLAQRRARRARWLARHPPKSYDPDKKPDPERWIPLPQRSYYRSSNRARRRFKKQGSTQGGVVSKPHGARSPDAGEDET
ncbi:hypothetical protein EV182_006153 [Spiromyces aspiralis]|uniref:Uncharacterized protein n=1 Tax=Spiromyces aspiralis TaxID=68401 RepID=A0ACC1HF44_9FUNG|nr:hypothetical protein EV182_006153 [Spiromyces aspiralis]